ncbi:MAG: FAD/NAD(P)-binding protein [Chloroflexi bacterium]|nr:FAD/NAD(P)-binding protein [Chloroflexota bacterium]
MQPYLATLKEARYITGDVKVLSVEINDPVAREAFKYAPGQFAFVSAFGVGESAVTFVSVPHRPGPLEFAIRRVGTVSAALHELDVGATLGVRGPYGNRFPLEDYRGKDILIIGGGIGMAPLRPVINYLLDHHDQYGNLTIINGARSPQDLAFAEEFETWAKAPRTRLELTVDRGDDVWKGRVALVPAVVEELKPSPANCVTITCGPPIMIRFVLQSLKKLGFADSQIVTTLEAKMKCGIGKCARCNVGEKYVCQDGPVFTFDQIATFLEGF